MNRRLAIADQTHAFMQAAVDAAVDEGTRSGRIPLQIPDEVKDISDAQTLIEALVACAYAQGRADATDALTAQYGLPTAAPQRRGSLRVLPGGAS